MSNLVIGKIGDSILLQALSAQKLHVGDTWITQGYVQSGLPREVTITAIRDHFIVDSNHGIWKLRAEHGDDFYAIVPKPPGRDTVTISRAKYISLLAESEFLRALQDAGVDNWDGYAAAQSDMHDEDDDMHDDDEVEPR